MNISSLRRITRPTRHAGIRHVAVLQFAVNSIPPLAVRDYCPILLFSCHMITQSLDNGCSSSSVICQCAWSPRAIRAPGPIEREAHPADGCDGHKEEVVVTEMGPGGSGLSSRRRIELRGVRGGDFAPPVPYAHQGRDEGGG